MPARAAAGRVAKEKRPSTHVLGPTAKHSLDDAAHVQLNLRSLAGGMEGRCQIAARQLEDPVANAQIPHRGATPQVERGEILEGLSPEYRNEYVGITTEVRWP